MERLGISWPAMVAVLTCALMMMVMIPKVSSTRFIVGANMGWSSNANYTKWAQDRHFYLGDWLFFVYDRHQMNVLEVKKTNYETCNSDNPIHNWTTGAGRDVVPLNVTRNYYFISGKGFCYGGMKLAVHVEKLPPPPSALEVHVEKLPPPPSALPVHVEKLPPPPSALPVHVEKLPPLVPSALPDHVETLPPPPSALPEKSDSSRFTLRDQIVIPAVFAIAAVWDSFLRVW